MPSLNHLILSTLFAPANSLVQNGINLAFARLLLEKKCNVIFADITLRPEAREVLHQYANRTPRAVFQETDVTEWPQLERLFRVADATFGGVDIVCPGAGVAEPVGVDATDWETLINQISLGIR